MKGEILEIIRIDVTSTSHCKGLLIRIKNEKGQIHYLSLHERWKVEFEVSKTEAYKVVALTSVTEDRLYPFSGPNSI